MRKEFIHELVKQARIDKDIYLLTGDLGFGTLDEFRDTFPDRFINVGAAECQLIGMTVGLALAGKRPFCYSITPFLIYRPFEAIHLYLDHDKINVKLIGSGVPGSYAHEGYTHNSDDAEKILKTMPNIEQYWPDDEGEEIDKLVKYLVESDTPAFVGLSR